MTQPTRGTTGPSDELTGLWVIGTVTRGGTGPCYGLATDDGRELALYANGAGSLIEGDRIRARVIVPVQPADCGSGEAMNLLEIKRIG